MKKQRANLRTCASCEWVHRGHEGCPKCGFATYGARWVYGSRCYKYAKTQKPWMDRKLSSYTSELLAEIESANKFPV
jgi:ribosomal protein L32